LAKVHRKVIKKSSRPSFSTGIILLIIGGAVIVVAAILVLIGVFKPKTSVAVASDPQGLAMCGSIPCPSKGDPTAPVIIVDVSSFVCSHCRDHFLNTEPKIDEQYVKTGKVHYIAHTLGFDSQAQGIAAAALCAGDQGKYWEYGALLFQNQGKFDPNSMALYAQQVGIDVQSFASCVNSGKHMNDVVQSSNSAEAAGVDGTPSFFINGKLVKGAIPFQCEPGTPECQFSDFQTLIETALKGGK
jgi:protein-disulfide isomerase